MVFIEVLAYIQSIILTQDAEAIPTTTTAERVKEDAEKKEINKRSRCRNNN